MNETTRTEELRLALEAAVKWIEEECRPEAEWAAEGHNFNMSGKDRALGQSVLEQARAALEKSDAR